MFHSLKDDIKRAWSRPENGLMQLIIVNAVVFVFLALLMVITRIAGADNVFEAVYKQFTIPGRIEVFLTRPWTIITYAFTHSLSNFFHILMNMLVLYWFGRVFVEFFGSQKLINLYILGAIAGGITYLLAYNLIPYYAERVNMFTGMVGASAAVFAIAVAVAVYAPNYTFFLLFFGPVKIKYLVGIYIFISVIGSVGSNAGGNLAHLGGALMGYLYIVQWRRGREMGVWIFRVMEFVRSLFVRRPRIRVTHKKSGGYARAYKKRPASGTPESTPTVSQEEIDAILDKISERGYDSLTKEEKEKLFNAGK